MRKLLFLLAIVFVFVSNDYAQNTEAKIKQIRKRFNWINSQKNFQIIQLNDQDFVDEPYDGGALAKAYFLDKNLYKISVYVGISFGEYLIDYYFWNDSLFFAYARFLQYQMENGQMNYQKTETIFEGRYYYDNQKLIKKIEKGTNDNYFTPENLLSQAQDLQLYSIVYFQNQDLYKKLQGKWISVDDNKSMIEIKGIVEDQFYDGNYLGSSRILISNGYWYSFGIGNDEKSKYQIDKITENEISLIYLPTGSLVKYQRKK